MPSQREIEIARLRGEDATRPKESPENRNTAGMRLPVTWPADADRQRYLEALAADDNGNDAAGEAEKRGPFPLDWRQLLGVSPGGKE